MKTLILALVLASTLAFAQSDSLCFQGTDTDQGPPLHYMKVVPCEGLPINWQTAEWRVLPPSKPGFFARHKRPIIIVSALLGAGGGALKASFERKGCNYAKFYPHGSGSLVNCPAYPSGKW
jgi:hypothetical protein